MNHSALRRKLVDAIDSVIAGTLPPDKANAIAKLAAAATNSLQAEINAVQAMRALGFTPALPIELEQQPPAIEGEATREDAGVSAKANADVRTLLQSVANEVEQTPKARVVKGRQY